MTASRDGSSQPHRAPGRRWPEAARVALVCAAAALGASAQLGACDRHADIRDEPDSGTIHSQPQLDAGDIPELDSGLGSDAYPPCLDRPEGDCRGTNDFVCDFKDWALRTAETCQDATGCKTNGWLEVTMGADGCVTEIGMDDPNDEVVACLLAEFGAVRCPCGEEKITYFFGFGNAGVCAQCDGEFPCREGEECVDGACVPVGRDAGGDGG